MTATVKVPNYTEAQVAELKATYVANPTKATVDALAVKFGKTARSVVAKLAKEQVYVSKAKETGKREMLKAEMVTRIAALVGKNDEQMESLEKATGPALLAVLHTLEALQP